MFSFAHPFIVAVYLAAPVVALIISMTGSVYGTSARRILMLNPRRLAMTLSVGVLIGCAVTMIYLAADGAGGRVSVGQTALAAYLAASLILVVTAIDGAIVLALRFISGRLRGQKSKSETSRFRRALAIGIPLLIRPALMIAVALPYVLVSVVTFRPKVTRNDDPHSRFNASFETVSFNSSDGLRLSAWWIPGQPARSSFAHAIHTTSTIVICHGIGSGKSDALRFAKLMLRDGYNVLLFDFRAHGNSGGQITTLGNLERRDVLAAVEWVRQHHRDASQHLFGFGISTGAAALIEAATDASPAGQSIDAVAVYEGFDSLDALGSDLVGRRFSAPIGAMLTHIGLSLGAIQSGASLHDVAPAKIVGQLWPRPILVVHSVDDLTIPFERGESLFNAADQPKQAVWLPMTLPTQSAIDSAAVNAALDFFDDARPVPVI